MNEKTEQALRFAKDLLEEIKEDGEWVTSEMDNAILKIESALSSSQSE